MKEKVMTSDQVKKFNFFFRNKLVCVILFLALDCTLCKTIPIYGCTCTRSIQYSSLEVDCANQFLRSVPNKLPQLWDAMVVFNLSLNNISQLWTSSLLKLKYLKKLDVSFNIVSSLTIQNTEVIMQKNGKWFGLGSTLQHLNLSHNKIQGIENDTFCLFLNLLYLDISDNFINILHERSFYGLKQLQVLDLRNNYIDLCQDSYPSLIFQDLKQLKSLNISNNLFSSKAESIMLNYSSANCSHTYPDQALSYLTSLEEIYLDPLPYPAFLGVGFLNLTSIKHIRFKCRSCAMGKASKLLFYNLNKKNVSEIAFIKQEVYFEPDIFQEFSSINSLIFSKISSDMENIGQTFKSLQTNQLKHLEISFVRSLFNKLTADWVVYLNDSLLETLIMENDNIIYIDHYFITSLPTTIHMISFRNNRIHNVNEILYLFLRMIRLEYLDISLHEEKPTTKTQVNEMNFGNLTLKNNSNAGSIQLFDRQFGVLCITYQTLHSQYPQEMEMYTNIILQQTKNLNKNVDIFSLLKNRNLIILPRNLSKLHARNMKLVYTVTNLRFTTNVLSTADFSNNHFYCLDGPITGLHLLKQLDLSNNFCQSLSPDFFQDFPSLEYLDLRRNFLGLSLESDRDGIIFSKLVNLQYLDLSYNYIRSISKKIFLGNPNLKKILLNNNELQEFDIIISHLVDLKAIDLSVNNLQRISQQAMRSFDAICRNKYELKVSLGGNRLSCDCDNFDFVEWFIESKIYFFDVHETYMCRYVNSSFIDMNKLKNLLKTTRRLCLGQRVMLPTLINFLVLVFVYVSLALYSYYRVRLLFYIYVSKARFFLNFNKPDNSRVKDVFIVYDDQDNKWRNFVLNTLKPELESRGVSTYISEIDSVPGRPLRMVIEDSVLAAKKTLVLLTSELFMFQDRELEVNMAKLSEEMRLTKVLLFVILEPILNVDDIPLHIRRYLEETEILRFIENERKFWDDLTKMIKS